MEILPQAAARLHRAVAEHLALSEADLRERCAHLERDVATYRELLQSALDQLHALAGRERVRVRRVDRLIAENAMLRGRLARVAA